MYFVKRGDPYIDVAGQSFRDLMAGKLPALPGERATSPTGPITLARSFPEVRLKRYLEMRGADGGPPGAGCRRCRRIGSASSTTTQRSTPPGTWSKGWTAEERQKLRDDVPRLGFKATIGGTQRARSRHRHAGLAQQGLARRPRLDAGGRDETRYLRAAAGVRRARDHAGRGVAGEIPRAVGRLSRARVQRIRVLSGPRGITGSVLCAIAGRVMARRSLTTPIRAPMRSILTTVLPLASVSHSCGSAR